ncbi:MAG TPA: type II toxin-antitoxin system RelE/ParE family toxin [Thermoflexia bacterium]|nr:MAG: type II toxin-antitoxin system RelE/ParE family toxin [Chloroflexota bacterium]HEY68320.1 type II toxin-antitoxin system RelE/ParE family toxin [Thermoflexia bacterium]
MTAFQLRIESSVRKRFRRIHPKHAAQIVRRLRMLETDPRPHDSIKLKGTKSAYRLTAGEYRILYEIDYDARVVTVFRIMHRGEGY